MEYKDTRLEKLADQLIKVINSRVNCFSTFTIIVPNRKLSEWFKAYWLKTRNDVFFNIEFKTLDEVLFEMFHKTRKQAYFRNLTENELRLILIKLLLQARKTSEYPEIQNYILDDNRLYDLADDLSSLYFQYEKENHTPKEDDWQGKLFYQADNQASTNGYISLGKLYKEQSEFEMNDDLYLFGFIGFDTLHQSILDCFDQNRVHKYMLEKDTKVIKNITITTVPSKIREIEIVHSAICEQLKNNNTVLSDFLVMAPNISEYEAEIHRVFKQDGKDYPNVAYNISGKSKNLSKVGEGIQRLIEIRNKEFFSRFDFFEMVSNPIVQSARNISEEDIDYWKQAILSMNVYRDEIKDWDYLKKRLLLSKITDVNDEDENIVNLSGNDFIPYNAIGLNNDSISKFIEAIDDLNLWLNVNDLASIQNELDKWFSFEKSNGTENNYEYIEIKKYLQKIESLKVDTIELPLNMLLFLLADGAAAANRKQGSFSKGVTFTSFDEKTILSAKYLFILNANTDCLPKLEKDNQLNRMDKKDSLVDKLNSLYIQCQNTNSLYISYIYENLKTEEELYPSVFVLDLMDDYQKQYNKELNVQKISIDEKRDWGHLFTQREFKNKDYYSGLLSPASKDTRVEDPALVTKKDSTNTADKTDDGPVRVKLSSLANFLTEPLKFKACALFGTRFDDEEQIQQEYEPFTMSPLDGSAPRKKLTREMIQLNSSDIDIDKAKKDLTLHHILPDMNVQLKEYAFDKIFNDAKAVFDLIHSNGMAELLKLADVSLGLSNCILTCDKEGYRMVDDTGLNRSYYDLSSVTDNKDIAKYAEKYAYPYVFSLMDVAQQPDDREYQISLYAKTNAKHFHHVITPAKARDLLNAITIRMCDFKDNYYFSIRDEFGKQKTYNDIKNAPTSSQDSMWRYYADKKMFDVDKQLGYSIDSFDIDFENRKNTLLALLNNMEATE